LALMDADVEAVPRVAVIEGAYHGHDGIRRWWEHLVAFCPTSSSTSPQCATSAT
jgi:hypothetical protein